MHISKITVKNLGPLVELNQEFGSLNLIYSHNEQGKTFLVEFIINCLFKNKGKWTRSLREISGSGKVWIDGINEKPLGFAPTSPHRIEDFLSEESPSLPADITKLLIVKGSETAIESRAEGGISKKVINNLLSQKEFLDEIDSTIKVTIRKASILNGSIIGDQRAEIKQLTLDKRKLKEIDSLIKQVSKEYSQGTIKLLKKEKDSLKEKATKLLNAKRHKAYQLKQESEELERQVNSIPEGELNSLSDNITEYLTLEKAYNRKKANLAEYQEQSQNYEWLEKARDGYKEYLSEDIGNFDYKWITGVLGLGATTGILIFFEYMTFALASFALFLTVVLWVIYYNKKALLAVRETKEFRKIKKEFKNRFKVELTDLAVLEERLHNEEYSYRKAQQLEEELNSEKDKLDEKELKIRDKFNDIVDEDVEPKEGRGKINQLREDLGEVIEKRQRVDKELARLNIDDSDFLAEDVAGIEYSEKKLENIGDKIDKIDKDIDSVEDELRGLRYQISSETRKDINTEWSTLFDELHTKRNELIEEIKRVKAEVIGKIFVHQVIEQLREEEDERIVKSFSVPEVQRPIFQITKRYKSINLQGEELYVSDEFDDFSLNSISTGAREQVMLALRMGLIAKLFNGKRHFLIFDDAFQHCDYPHRKVMVRKMAELARNGSQIFYLTMDDHLRDLFNTEGAQFDDSFKSISLNN